MGWDSNSHITLTAPVSLADISWATGTGGPPYDLGDMILNHASTINKWARYKPVRHENTGILLESQRARTNYGLYIPYYRNFANMADDVANGVATNALNYTSGRVAWGYEPPRGLNGGGTGVHEWYRALDFDGYYTPAQFLGQCSTSAYCQIGDDLAVTCANNYNAGSVRPSILSAINTSGSYVILGENMYLGICIRMGGASRYSWTLGSATSFDTASVSSIYASARLWLSGNANIFLYLSSVQKSLSDAEDNTGYYIPLTPTLLNVLIRREEWSVSFTSCSASQSGRTLSVSWAAKLNNDHTLSTSGTLICESYTLDPNQGEIVIDTYTQTGVTISTGGNSGTITRSAIDYIISKVVLTFNISNEYGNASDTYTIIM